MLFEVGIQRQHHERQVHVDQAYEHRKRAEEQWHGLVAEAAEHAVDDSRQRRVGAEDDHPGVDANQKIAPERENDQQQKQISMLLAALGDQRCQRIREQETEKRRQQRIPDRLGEQAGIGDQCGHGCPEAAAQLEENRSHLHSLHAPCEGSAPESNARGGCNERCRA